MTPSECPTVLALERLLSGELQSEPEAALKSHVRGCARCSERLQSMERSAAEFSRSPRSAPAKAAFHRADRAWRRNAMLAVTLPLAAAALAAVAPTLVSQAPPPVVATQEPAQWAKVHARTAPTFLEPRGGEGPARLRQVSLHGRKVAFGSAVLEGAVGDGEPRPFVLRHTDVDAQVSGFVSSVTVTQEFENPFSEPVEAVYVFPLPDDAAVDEMTLVAGDRVIRAQIHKREAARRIYEEAKQAGRHAALLDQERPNIFTQSVANLLPHETVKVTLHYVNKLRFDDGQYVFNFPMTVGPRYIPGAAVPGESQGSGTHADTTDVLDASRITPPVERTGRDISVKVRLDAGLPIEGLESVSHRLQLETLSPREGVVTLDPADRIPNKDLVLRWKVMGAERRAALLASGGEGGTFALMLAPEAPEARVAALPKEMVFVIDTSCSMSGPPLEAAKQAMALAMQQMGPNDTFMLIDFADTASSFHASPLPNTPMNVQRAIAYLRSLPASGGTNQLAGIRAALGFAPDPKRLREVLLMTDGFIGNEREILAAEDAMLGEARVFGFGVGTSVNHYLLSRMSESGRGFYQYIRPDQDPTEAVQRFVRRINRPMLTDLELEWSGTQVFDVLPRKVPDLFDAQPLVLVGRYRNPGAVHLTLRGRRGNERVEMRVDGEIPAQSGQATGLRQLWARARIEELDAQQHFGERGDVIQEITTLGLEHHLVTAYTSLVAVDDRKVTRGGPTRQVAVPTEKPELTKTADTTVVTTPKAPDDGIDRDSDGIPDAVDAVDTWNGTPPTPAPPAHHAGPIPVAKPPTGTSVTREPRAGGADSNGDDFSRHFGDDGKETGKDGDFDNAFGGQGKGGLGGGHLGKGSVFIPPQPGTTSPRKTSEYAFREDVVSGDLTKPDPKLDEHKTAGRARDDDEFYDAIIDEKLLKRLKRSPDAGVPETLGQSDVMEVVLSHKAELAKCAADQHLRDPKLTGKLVMKWTILTSGRVGAVEVVSTEFKSTYMATCLSNLIRHWVFPPHKTQGEPVVFPFKF